MNDSSLFARRAALVTGAAAGIGRATAELIASHGGSVMIADIDDAGGRSSAEAIQAAGGQAEFTRCDVTNSADARAAVEATVHAYGRLDLAVNNAGWEGAPATLADYDEDAWHKLISVNLTGVFLCMQQELKVMIPQQIGAIVNMASISGLVGNAEFAPYNATKHGVIGLTKGAALENATSGIRINAVCPGFVDTEMVARIGGTPGSALRAAAMEAHPMNRLASAPEIAEAVVWLLSDRSAFVTGHALVVDGGYVAR
jgi:NAD(P)-dependent dehydrogenase (short-subunit alcohol dehydrogenase family)